MYDICYKCMLCGRLLVLDNPQNIPYDSLPELCGKIIKNQQFICNPILHQAPLQIPCKCKDGNCGMAYFAGMIKIQGGLIDGSS